MIFSVGDHVIHPRLGLGLVTKLAIKQFGDEDKRLFYEMSFPDSTLWVPLTVSTSGIRKLSVKGDICDCRRLLMAPAASLNADPRLRQTELVEHLKEGTIAAHCEVVRDLTAYSWRKKLSGALAAFLSSTREVLCQEWAAVEGIPHSEAAREIEGLLDRGKPVEING